MTINLLFNLKLSRLDAWIIVKTTRDISIAQTVPFEYQLKINGTVLDEISRQKLL